MSDRNIQQQSSFNRLGRYKILQRLGRGGMGEVWLCEDPRLHRQVAIKTLPVHTQQDSEFVLRFEREAQAAAVLNHPHILPVHDYGKQPQADGTIVTYIVMPYIRGGSLNERIASYPRKLMPYSDALAFLSQAAEAIDYAHEQQVIHRDIKPGNMLLRDDNWLLLADFGIARILTSPERLTATGPGIGTAEYMAPEQAHGQAVAGSDNYSLAVIAYQLFTGQLPFQADTNYAITIQHLTTQPPPPRQINPDISLALEKVLLQGLAKQPSQRYASAGAFIAALQNALPDVSVEKTNRTPTTSHSIDTFINPDYQQTGTGLETVRTDPVRLDAPRSTLTRRRLLIGGSTAAIVALGGLGTWEIVSSANRKQGSTQPKPTVKITASSASPDAPKFILTGHNRPAQTLAWHPQKRLLVSTSGLDGDNSMITWNIDTLPSQPNKSPQYTALAPLERINANPLEIWSSDGKYLAIVNNQSDTTQKTALIDLYLLDLKTLFLPKNPTMRITIPTNNTISGLSWLHNRYIVTVEQIYLGSNFLLRMTDITTPNTQWKAATLQGYLAIKPEIASDALTNTLTVSPDNSTIAIALSGETVLVGQINISGNAVNWQKTIDPLQLPVDSQPINTTGAVWSADGNKIISVNTDDSNTKGPTFWNWRESKPQPQTLSLSTQDNSVKFSALASNPASTNPCFATGNKNGEVSLWNAVAGTLPIKTLNNQGISGPVVAMAWSQDGHWLAASFGNAEADILIWKL